MWLTVRFLSHGTDLDLLQQALSAPVALPPLQMNSNIIQEKKKRKIA